MFFRQRAAENATLSYLFGCTGVGRAVAVDVVSGDEHWFVAEAAKVGVPITHVIDTHVHTDHYCGGPELARRVGAPYCLHESNRGRLAFDFTPMADGQRLDAGNVVVDVLHTPGHTPDSLHRKLLSLPDDLEIYPGHQAGSACGVGLSGKPSSTLGFEKRWNPGLSMSRAEFIETLVHDIAPPPADMDAMLRFNLGRAERA